MGYERNDRRPGGYSGERGGYGGERGWSGQGRDDYRGGAYGSSAGARDYRDDRSGDAGRRDYGGDPRGYDDRGFLDRAGDEVRSWFGDEEAERRRRDDERRDQVQNRYGNDQYRDRDHGARSYGGTDDGNRDRGRAGYGGASQYDRGSNAGGYGGRSYGGSFDRGSADRDRHDDQHAGYRSWRDRQIQSFDQDYDEYRRENQSRFDQEFHSWRQTRQGQRDLVAKVKEHQDVVGSDGQHVGTVDHVRGDQLKLTKSDEAAGGHHHLIPASWIQSVEDKVTLNKTADQAKQHWRDAEQQAGDGGLFGRNDGGDRSSGRTFDRAFGESNA